MNECEKIDNMLFQLEYELLSSSPSINLLPSFLSLFLSLSLSSPFVLGGREKEIG